MELWLYVSVSMACSSIVLFPLISSFQQSLSLAIYIIGIFPLISVKAWIRWESFAEVVGYERKRWCVAGCGNGNCLHKYLYVCLHICSFCMNSDDYELLHARKTLHISMVNSEFETKACKTSVDEEKVSISILSLQIRSALSSYSDHQ